MPVITVPPILVSSSEVVLDPKPEGKLPFKHIAKGQVVSAKVLKALSGRQALLLIDGQRVTAKTFLPLQPGQTLLLRLEQTGDRQVFKFAGQPGEAAGHSHSVPMGTFGKAGPYLLLARLIGDPGMPADGGAQEPLIHPGALKDLLAGLSLKSGTPVPAFLERLLNGSGLLWESKLAALASREEALTPEAVRQLVTGDLKAVCLRLLSGAGGTLPETLAGQLRGVLEGLEQHQLLNQHLLENDNRYLLPIPLSEQETLKFGQLLIGLGGQKGAEGRKDRLVTVSFLLSLSRLGELRADFSILKEGLTGAFGVADESARALVTAHLPELRKKLQDHGYSVLDISCRVLEPRQLSEMNFVAQAVAAPDGGFFNLVV
jgi:hypothetical protein